MNREMKNHLKVVYKTLEESRLFEHAGRLVSFDRQTVCPREGVQRQGEIGAHLSNRAYAIKKDRAFIKSVETLYKKREELGEPERVLVRALHREYLRTKNISTKEAHRYALIYNRAFGDWLRAKEASDFSLFADSLRAVRDAELEQVKRSNDKKKTTYDALLDRYERGMTGAVLDETFEACKERLVPFMKKIKKSKKIIRTDFLNREVTNEQQRILAEYLLDILGYDFSRGVLATSEHPFTDDISRDDIRVTTHYYPTRFSSSMYSVIHECGHALFGQNMPAEDYRYYINNEKTLGMHESVSRFYENRIGHSRAFVHLIMGRAKEIMPQVFRGVTEKDFYEAVNVVEPSLIRVEADELTYTLHIIIRYEIEKEIVRKRVRIEDIPRLWAEKYRQYLGVRVKNDRDGALQDVHWSSGFGYFPTYALSNLYNAMYYNRMKEDINIDSMVKQGKISVINDWMKEHVFKKADYMDAREWVTDITGRSFTPDDFLDYLEEKYGELYGL